MLLKIRTVILKFKENCELVFLSNKYTIVVETAKKAVFIKAHMNLKDYIESTNAPMMLLCPLCCNDSERENAVTQTNNHEQAKILRTIERKGQNA